MIKLLAVDDDKNILNQIKFFFLEEGYNVFTSNTAQAAIEIVKHKKPEIIIVDYDLPETTGIDLIKKIKKIDETVKVILISGKIDFKNMNTEIKNLEIAECIPKPFKMKYLKEHTFPLIQKRQFIKEKNLLKTIKDLELKSLQVAINALETKDKYTDGHSKRVKKYALEITNQLNKNPDRKKIKRKNVEWSALLHDIGKIGIKEKILNKPGKLTKNEFLDIKNHPVESVKILSPLKKYYYQCIEAVKHHHERIDGSGYPSGLKGNDIPVISKILSVADAFDAMTSGRVYRNKISTEKAIKELNKNKKTQFDPEVVDAFNCYLSDKKNSIINYLYQNIGPIHN